MGGLKGDLSFNNSTGRDSDNCCSLAVQQAMNSSIIERCRSCSRQRLQLITLADGRRSWVEICDHVPQMPPLYLVKLKYQTWAEASKQSVHPPLQNNKASFSFQHGGKVPVVPVSCLSKHCTGSAHKGQGRFLYREGECWHPEWENSLCYWGLKAGLILSCHYVLMSAHLPLRRIRNLGKPAPWTGKGFGLTNTRAHTHTHTHTQLSHQHTCDDLCYLHSHLSLIFTPSLNASP